MWYEDMGYTEVAQVRLKVGVVMKIRILEEQGNS
jgi:hypothetical protein